MSMVWILIPLGVALVACACGMLIWAVNANQFDDLDDAGHIALEPDETPDPPDQTRDRS